MKNNCIDDSFWKNKRVLVTGHTGFKGSWLSFWLAKLGAEVTGYSLPPVLKDNLFNSLNLKDLCHHYEGNILDFDKLKALILKTNPEIVFHLAAQPLVLTSYETPVETYNVNIMGTAHVLEACRALKDIQSILIVTSDKCYQNNNNIYSFRETDTLGGHDPYSSSKACAEIISSAYRDSFKFGKNGSISTVRSGNIFGGGDWSDYRIIPDAVKCFSLNEELILRQPQARRPWQFVVDPLRGYITLAQKSATETEFAQAWNFGPDVKNCVTVREIVKIFADEWGSSSRWSELAADHAMHETHILRLDSTKALTHLGWQNQYSLCEGLKLTAMWYKQFYSSNNSVQELRDLTWRQIQTYN